MYLPAIIGSWSKFFMKGELCRILGLTSRFVASAGRAGIALGINGHYGICRLRINGGQHCGLRITNNPIHIPAGLPGSMVSEERKGLRKKRSHAEWLA